MSGLAKRLGEKIRYALNQKAWQQLTTLSWAQLKVIDRSTLLGFLWSLIVPVVFFAVMYVVFNRRFGSSIEHYPFYLLIGVIVVQYFVTATSRVLSRLGTSREMVIATTIPREILVLSILFVDTYKFLIEMVLCVGLSVYWGLFDWARLPMFMMLIFSFLCFSSGISWILMVCYGYLRDTVYIWSLITRLFYFICPIFYSLENLAPAVLKMIYWCNPVTPFLVAFRNVLIRTEPIDWQSFWVSSLWGSLLLVIGYIILTREENKIAEKL